MKISHESYLKQTLSSKKIHLEELQVQHRINVALHNDKTTSLTKEIDSLERQLEVDK